MANESVVKKLNMPLLGTTGVLAAIGLICWIMRLAQGVEVLEVSQTIPWSLYIAAFFLLVGAGGGLLIAGSLIQFGVFPALKDHFRKLMIGAVACFIPGAIMILLDAGVPGRVFNIILSPNFTSMFVWDFILLVLSGVLALALIFMKENKILTCLAACAGTAVIIVEGLILTNAGVAASFWHSPLIPVSFLVEGIALALAVLLIVYSKEALDSMKGALAACLGALLIFALVEIITVSYMGTDAAASLAILVSGSLAPLYWSQIILGLVVPIGLLLWKKGPEIVVTVAAVLAILGVVILKMNLLIAGQAIDAFGVQAVYSPGMLELGGIIGAFGCAAFLAVLGGMLLKPKA